MGEFRGLNNKEWAAVESLIPYPWVIAKRGQRPLHPRKILNTLIWVLITGARWCDVPRGKRWASRSCAHKYLGIWMRSGLLDRVLRELQEVCMVVKMIDLKRLAVDGFFSPGKGGGERVDHGYKGKGMTSHLLVDGLGQPLGITSTGASGNERKEVIPLLKKNQRVANPYNLSRHDSDSRSG